MTIPPKARSNESLEVSNLLEGVPPGHLVHPSSGSSPSWHVHLAQHRLSAFTLPSGPAHPASGQP